ncbi:HD domain-containing protein [Weeksellaceae bacterium TAE3-ERU29]|nr:HD domain-containing protein [Weeksellaceae bacterium TAE3-ERU29]
MKVNEKIDNSISFIIELEKLKAVYRKAVIKSDGYRRENSAEHSWHASLASQILFSFSDIEVDINKVIKMLLIHEISEIYAGDFFAFGDSENKNHHQDAERKAINDLFKNFPIEFVKSVRDLWWEFEETQTLEAQFAVCIDRIIPFIQNMNNQGGSWSEFKITKTQILKRNSLLKSVSTQLWDYINMQLDYAVSQGWVIDN